MTETLRLSHGFSTTEYNEEMSRLELGLRSGLALTLGTIPYLTASIAMQAFKGMAHLASKTEKPALRGLCGVLGVPAGAAMTASAKLFGLSQHLAWGDYAEEPQGDGPNTRLAWYGLTKRPWHDLAALSKAFFATSKQDADAWTLQQWSQVRV